MSASDVRVTVVRDAQELQGAVKNSATHIELRNHIDLTLSQPLDGQGNSVQELLGWPGAAVESLRVRYDCVASVWRVSEFQITVQTHSTIHRTWSERLRT
jgi:hypothetical protein